MDASGNLYIADSLNHRIRILRADGILRTIAGAGGADFTGDGGDPLLARFNTPTGVAVDALGRIYVADSLNDRIRVILPSPPAVTSSVSALSINASSGLAEVRLTSAISDLAFTTAVSAPWLTVSPQTGTLPASIQVSANPAGLAPGTYSGTVTINTPRGTPAVRTVTVTYVVGAPAPSRLRAGSQSISFGSQLGAGPSSIGLGLTNLGSGELDFTATVRTVSGGTWLAVSPASGRTDNGSATLALTATPGTLAEGTYSASIVITGGGAELTIPATMAISRPRGKILLSQTGLSFTGVEGGGTPSPQSFGVLNEGVGELPFDVKITALSGGNWLRLGAAAGRVVRPLEDIGYVEAAVNMAGLRVGEYYAEIRVGSPGLTPQIVTAVLKVLPRGSTPGPDVQPAGLVFIGAAGSTPSSQEVRVANVSSRGTRYVSSSLTVDGAKWVSHQPAAAAVNPDEPQRVIVQPDFIRVAPGVRRGAIYLLFDDGTSRTVNVLSIIPESPGKAAARGAVGCGRNELNGEFRSLRDGDTFVIGQPVPIEVRIADTCGFPLLGNERNANSFVVAQFSNGDPNLQLRPVGGGVWSGTWRPVNPMNGTVQVSAISLFVQGTVVQGGRTDRNVRLSPNVNTPIVRQGALVHGASQRGDRPIAPGTLISIYGDNLAAQGDTTEVVLGGERLPVLFTSANQINAQVPYALDANTIHQVVVKRGGTQSVPESFTVSSAQPGIFTVNQQGTGQAVVIGPDQLSLADPSSPARRGEAIVIYATGLGAVSPEVPVGTPAPGSPLARVVSSVQVVAGDKPALVLFAGLTPGFTGLYQINALLAADTPVGDVVPLAIIAGTETSNIATIAVR